MSLALAVGGTLSALLRYWGLALQVIGFVTVAVGLVERERFSGVSGLAAWWSGRWLNHMTALGGGDHRILIAPARTAISLRGFRRGTTYCPGRTLV